MRLLLCFRLAAFGGGTCRGLGFDGMRLKSIYVYRTIFGKRNNVTLFLV